MGEDERTVTPHVGQLHDSLVDVPANVPAGSCGTRASAFCIAERITAWMGAASAACRVAARAFEDAYHFTARAFRIAAIRGGRAVVSSSSRAVRADSTSAPTPRSALMSSPAASRTYR